MNSNSSDKLTIKIREPILDEGNVDVEVFIGNQKYIGTFFTLKNIQSLLDSYKKTGECKNGLYFWASNMIIVESLSYDIIKCSIEDMISSKEFFSLFDGPFKIEKNEQIEYWK